MMAYAPEKREVKPNGDPEVAPGTTNRRLSVGRTVFYLLIAGLIVVAGLLMLFEFLNPEVPQVP